MGNVVIQNFTEVSALQTAGAKVGDVIFSYNGIELHSVSQLLELKSQVNSAEVAVVLSRGADRIPVTIKGGQLGAFLKDIVPDHVFDPDAVIIKDIEPLNYESGRDNSFLGVIYNIDQKFGAKTSYQDLVGLSGYGFRLQFFDGWCPSSPDATCGKNVGELALIKLGYESEWYQMKTAATKADNLDHIKTLEEMTAIIINSIDGGWPVIAIDLMEVPEWGIITGYQKSGKEFLCRTYFDKTTGYELTKKLPFLFRVISNKKSVDLTPEYKNSLILARELYNTEKYDHYFSGIRAIEEWIKALQDEKTFTNSAQEKLTEVRLANWYIYVSLQQARRITVDYLKGNREKFGVAGTVIDELVKLYEQEATTLETNSTQVPSPHTGQPLTSWTKDQRDAQVKTLQSLLSLEKEVQKLLASI